MLSTLSARSRAMRDCRWAARRIQAYLDVDPSALLLASEARRIEEHLLGCPRCLVVTRDLCRLTGELGDLGSRHAPDPDAVARLREWALLTLLSVTATDEETS